MSGSSFAVIERLLAKNPDERFQTADAMLAAVAGKAAADAPTQRISAGKPRAVLDPTAPARPAISDSSAAKVAGPLLPPAVVAFGQRAMAASLTRGNQTWQRARALGGRFWLIVLSVVAVIWGGYEAGHFLVAHRSRCPSVERATSSSKTGEQAKAAQASTRPWSVWLDALQPASKGSEIDVYFDVCELPDDAKFSATLDITRNQSGIRKLFGGGGVEPIRREFGMAAGSPRERRHEEVELGSLPAGSYTVRVTITDDKGRTRARSVPLEITGQ